MGQTDRRPQAIHRRNAAGSCACAACPAPAPPAPWTIWAAASATSSPRAGQAGSSRPRGRRLFQDRCRAATGGLGADAVARRSAQAGGRPDRRHPRHGTAHQEPGRRIAALLRAGHRTAQQAGRCAQGKPDRSPDRHRQPQGVRRRAWQRPWPRRQEAKTVSLLLCDIDHFKKFNDTWGHQTGDQVLRLVANCLSENVKGRDTAARYGGEEFAVRAARHRPGSRHPCRRPDPPSGRRPRSWSRNPPATCWAPSPFPSASPSSRDGEAAEAVIRRADACLYGAKQHGRNLVVNQNDARMAALEISAA